MKKLLILLFFFVVILFTSCGSETPNESAENTTPHIHDFSGEMKYDENGHYTTCECGEVSRSEHVEGSSLVVKKANCVEEGQKFAVCKECGYRGVVSLPKLEHTHEKYDSTPATCIQKGVTAYEHCDICNIDIGKETVPKISHDYKDEFCTMCGSRKPSEYIKFELLNGGWAATFNNKFDKAEIEITELYIPSYTDTGEKVVGIGGFKDVQQLKKVILPEGIQFIDEYAFYGCSNLEEVQFLGDPNSVLTIKEFAFHGCSSLKKLEFPEKCFLDGDDIFLFCRNLKSFDSMLYGAMGGNVFGYCYSLEKISFDDSVESVGWWAFEYCYSLKEVELGNRITHLEEYAFESCSSLETITLPDTVIEIDRFAFRDCERLKSIVMSNNLKSLDEYAFSGCVALESITIPQTIESIGEYVFEKCYSLKEINYEGTIEDWNNIANRSEGLFYWSSVKRIICSDGVIEL